MMLRMLRSVGAVLLITCAMLLTPVTAQAATNYFCDEYTGAEFLLSPTQSWRDDAYHVHLAFQSDLPVSVKVYADGTYVGYFTMNAHPVNDPSNIYTTINPLSSQGHYWSAGSYAFDTIVPNSWDSSLGYGNHCGSNYVYIPAG